MTTTTDGVGIEFERDGMLCITLPRSGHDFDVRAEITSYAGIVMFAEHFYASLHISDLSFHKKGDPDNYKSWSNTQPKESRFDRIDVTIKAPKTIYGKAFERKIVEVYKDFPTSRFNNIVDCIGAIEKTFKEKFLDIDLNWNLTGSNHEPWEEAKIELIEIYKK